MRKEKRIVKRGPEPERKRILSGDPKASSSPNCAQLGLLGWSVNIEKRTFVYPTYKKSNSTEDCFRRSFYSILFGKI